MATFTGEGIQTDDVGFPRKPKEVKEKWIKHLNQN